MQKVLEVMQGVEAENKAVSKGGKRKTWSEENILPSRRLKKKAVALFGEVLRRGDSDIMKQVVLMHEGGAKLNLPGVNRVGRPKYNWLIETAREAWNLWQLGSNDEFDYKSESSARRLIEKANEAQEE